MAKSLFSVLSAALCLAAAPFAFGQGPVHVALNASPSVTSQPDGFFTLGQIAVLSGGDAATRTRMSAVPVGRIPLAGDTRRLAWGDVALKLRQAGFHPDKDARAEGAAQVCVSVADAGPPPPAAVGEAARTSLSPAVPVVGAAIIHKGDAVTILVQSGALTITAPGIAREAGAAGATIRVHREGIMGDVSVIVVNAQTVQLEI